MSVCFAEQHSRAVRAFPVPASAHRAAPSCRTIRCGCLFTDLTASIAARCVPDWRAVTLTGTAPKDAVFAHIVLSSKDNTGKILFDDVTLAEG